VHGQIPVPVAAHWHIFFEPTNFRPKDDTFSNVMHFQDAFPGAQPTSLTRQKVGEQLLQDTRTTAAALLKHCWSMQAAQEPYLVCEKTDGERHLLLAYQGP